MSLIEGNGMPDFVLEWGVQGTYPSFAYATAENEADASETAWHLACRAYDASPESAVRINCECCGGTGHFTDTEDNERCDVCEGIGFRFTTTEEYQAHCEKWIEYSAIAFDPEVHTDDWLEKRQGEDFR